MFGLVFRALGFRLTQEQLKNVGLSCLGGHASFGGLAIL